MLTGKTVVLGVTGSIAAYKIAALASALKQRGANIHVLMTKNATQFINPITFETLTDNKCLVDTFDRNFQFSVEHVSIAKQGDVVLIAPATANVIGKLANGLADDMLTTTVMACPCKKLISPAMNTRMFENPIVQDNLQKLARFGYTVIRPASGYLACGDTGAGKMPEPEVLLSYIEQEIGHEKDLAGRRVLVTAGPTQEPLDPVRYLTNHSTGKMGYALARAAAMRGADVTLVSGQTALARPRFVHYVQVTTAKEMFDAVVEAFPAADVVIKAAAVADYRPAAVADHKMKKQDKEADLTLALARTQDILGYLGAHRRADQFLCGFAMETEHLLENARAKLAKKHLDMIAANSLSVPGAGFAGDTNVMTLITKEGETALPLLSKEDTAHRILDEVVRLTGQR